MKITDIQLQAKNPDRVNISVDGNYRFSLDVYQVGELGLKVDKEYSDEEIVAFEQESMFGKLYARALEYALMRPHSAKEMRDYLWRKTRERFVKNRRTGEITKREGLSQSIADRVYDRLEQRGYINDERFTKYWIENRNLTKGSSQRKIVNELRVKGVSQGTIDSLLSSSPRSDDSEIEKIIAKKRSKYDDQKLMQYLARQGFSFDLIKHKIIEAQHQENEKD